MTLYAVWSSQNADAEFYIRLDGTIPTEPQGHAASEYTGAIKKLKAIKIATFFTDSTNGVASHLNSTPTDAQIENVMSAKNLSYDSSKQYILWYVIKKESTWHIDGVLLDKAKVNLVYAPNAPAGTWKNMPDGAQYTVGSTVTVSNEVPTRTGYIFTGWNTRADGTGTSYSGTKQFNINENTTLYAQWTANEGTAYTVRHYKVSADGNSTELALQENLTGKTDTEVTATAKEFAGYTYQAEYDQNGMKTVASGTVAGDGSLVLNLYYTPDDDQTVQVTYRSASKTAGDVTNDSDAIQIVTAEEINGSTATANAGYAFAGWYKDGNLISTVARLGKDTVKANLNVSEDGLYAETEFVAHWKGLEVSKVVDSVVDSQGNAKDANKPLSLGDTITYKITVSNIGTVDLKNIVVSDEMAGVELAKDSNWDIAEIKAGETSEPIYATYTVQESDLGKETLDNIATAIVKEDKDVPVKHGKDSEKIDDVNASFNATKAIVDEQQNRTFGVGNTVNFKITVTNTGNVTLNNVTIDEKLVGATIDEGSGYVVKNNVAKIETLAPNTSVTVYARYTVTQDDVDNADLVNTAEVNAKDPEGKDLESQDPSVDVPTDDKEPNVTAVKSIANPKEGGFQAGDTVNFNITVTNVGNVTLKEIIVEEMANVVIDNGDNYTVKNKIAKITSLAPTKEIVVNAHYVVTQEDIDRGDLRNVATVKVPGIEEPKELFVPVPLEEQNPSYTVVKILTNLEEATGTKTAEDGTTSKAFKEGETAKFDITVKNTGNVTLTGIEVTDTLAGAKLVAGEGYDLTKAGTAVIEKIAPTDEAVVIKAEYVVTQTDVESGGTENLVTSTAKGPGDPEKPTPVDPDPVKPEPVPTEDPAPAVAITKTTTSTSADAVGYAEDETITYDIQATNTGNVTLHDVVITNEKTRNTWNVETLVPNASTDVYKASYKVTQADILVGEVENTAVVVGTPARAEKEAEVAAQAFEEVVPNNTVTASASVKDPTVKPSSALKVTKTVTSKGSTITIDGKDVNGYRVGDTIEFNIHVENTGNITLNNIVVNDVPTLDAGSPKGSITIAASADGKYTVDGSTATIATLAPKTSVDIKASYLVMAGDGTVKGNKLFNTAFATGTSEDPNNPQPGDSSKTDPVPIEPEPDDGNGAMEGSITVTKMITTSDGKTPTSGVNAAIKVGLYDNASFSGTPIAVNTITISNATSGNTVFNELDNTANTTYYVAELDANNQPIVAANAHLEGYGAPAYSDNCKRGINPTTATDTAATIINPLEALSAPEGGLEETEDTTEKTTEKSSTTSDSSTSTKSSTAAKTGDDTNMMIYWLLLGMAVLAGCTAVVYRKRKER